jgi:hypothetical protein
VGLTSRLARSQAANTQRAKRLDSIILWEVSRAGGLRPQASGVWVGLECRLIIDESDDAGLTVRSRGGHAAGSATAATARARGRGPGLVGYCTLYSLLYGMVWCPSYPPSVCSVTRVVASCSVHPVSERHRQAVQSALVRRWVRPCDAGIGKEWNRGCLHETKSSGISLRCTCLALLYTHTIQAVQPAGVQPLRALALGGPTPTSDSDQGR